MSIASTNRGDGYPLVNVGYSGSSSKYCCGAVAYKDNEVTCAAEGGPFSIDFGTAIAGVAGLAVNNTDSDSGSSGNSTTVCDNNSGSSGSSTSKEGAEEGGSSNRDVAIGAGVGVPLGAIALASVAWALWERRQRRVAERVGTAVAGKEGGEEYMNLDVLGGGGGNVQPAELVDSRPVLSELDGGKVVQGR
jgi:hypothetical protein